jgi:hypothetical protein
VKRVYLELYDNYLKIIFFFCCKPVQILFLTLLMTTVYSAKDSSRFFLHRAIWKRFSHRFSEIKTVEDFYPWANGTLLPNLYGDYRGKDSSGAEGRQVSPPETPPATHGKLKVSWLLHMTTALWTTQSPPGLHPKRFR